MSNGLTEVFSIGLRSPASFASGLPFSLTLLTILMAHEMGHYLACVWYGVDATLPFFLPSPVPGTGTFGAFIRIRSHIPTKRVLFDIGVAGPLAGFVFLAPALFIGLAYSRVLPGIGGSGGMATGRAAAAVAGAKTDFSRRTLGGYLPASHGARRLGRHAGHGYQPAARRPTGWRPCRVRAVSAALTNG